MSRYKKSEEMLERALRTIPLGSQTFSKSMTQYPFGVSPYFITHGRGSHVWDVDGNEYVDFINSLCAITLGYCDQDVDNAVREQLDRGVIFSLPSPLEAEVAELIVELVPCAEMVRFGKNGSDATSGAIRVARAYTSRDRVAVCGYHGWQDWYIGSTPRSLGVPEATRSLTHSFRYNDIDSFTDLLKQHPGEFAAVILEPMNIAYPKPGFLEAVRDISAREGILLIFDETITGFRMEVGGAQQRFGVTPDLASFGKGLANGYPLSAVAGRAEYMRLMEEVFFSFTFGGETLSLAAAKATLTKLQREPVIETLKASGTRIMGELQAVIADAEIGDVLSVAGDPVWSFLVINPTQGVDPFVIKTYLLQELFRRGILTLGTHNLSYAHSAADIDQLMDAYRQIIPHLRDGLDGGTLRDRLECDPLEPLFKLR